jgi:hypothetical protein
MTIKEKAAIVGVGATPYVRRGQSYPRTTLATTRTWRAPSATRKTLHELLDDVDAATRYRITQGAFRELFPHVPPAPGTGADVASVAAAG